MNRPERDTGPVSVRLNRFGPLKDKEADTSRVHRDVAYHDHVKVRSLNERRAYDLCSVHDPTVIKH